MLQRRHFEMDQMRMIHRQGACGFSKTTNLFVKSPNDIRLFLILLMDKTSLCLECLSEDHVPNDLSG